MKAFVKTILQTMPFSNIQDPYQSHEGKSTQNKLSEAARWHINDPQRIVFRCLRTGHTMSNRGRRWVSYSLVE